MSKKHVVCQGEHLAGIAGQYGLHDFRIIWNHPDNAELKKKRLDPGVLYPGDIVSIPDLETGTYDRATEQRHSFVLSRTGLTLCLKLERALYQPIGDTPCELSLEQGRFDLVTDPDGTLSHPISDSANQAALLVKENINVNGDPVLFETGMNIRIGHLDPVEEASGQVARLSNLGYYRASIDKIDNDELVSAIEEFQCDNGLPLTGVCDGVTQAKLREVHGS
jgi:hypothetical protein